jgi:hypothetical protein
VFEHSVITVKQLTFVAGLYLFHQSFGGWLPLLLGCCGSFVLCHRSLQIGGNGFKVLQRYCHTEFLKNAKV